MMDRPVSDSLKDLLGRQGMRRPAAGTVKPAMMKWANDLLDREEGWIDEDHSPSGDFGRPMRKPKVRIVRAMPFLAVIDGGLR